MTRPAQIRTCECRKPSGQVSGEGVAYCGRCGERLPEPSNAVVLLKLEQLADLVKNTSTAPAPRLLDAQEVADHLGLSKRFVYKHAEALQGVKVGGALRFDLDKVREGFEQLVPRPFGSTEDRA